MNFLALGLIIPLAACSFSWDGDKEGSGVAASGSGTTRTYQVTGFDQIDLQGSDDVDVRVGTGFSIRAEGPSDQLDRLKIDRDGETLDIGRKNGASFGWNKGAKVKVYVTLPRLTAATISGSGYIAVNRVEGKAFTGTIAGSGDMTLATIQVDEARFSVTGSGALRASGTARALNAEIAGSGDVDASKLRAQSAKIDIPGSGSVRAVVDGPAIVDISGSGDVDLGPKARCTISKTGSGSVRCGN
ncbi:putative autotransporter adhesin-like protein [Sphingomonas sp. PP-CE-3A-406]|uniref:head GIN domain-containing protein n=1 Tax=Sphingomonas sp. PP-CE-3A-406 TaxID=2135659 RepID=UPI000EF9D910|nr:head GIN domain-containing protein [Sphingomonas sp. PP-CE-3A-406]RMB51709.1 putative autotransporter adhesin-like protein [Sphingomonas sp. PP-CE-3A-406]